MNQQNPRDQNPPKSNELSGKIMLSVIVIIFFIVVFMVILHVYTRWYLVRLRRSDTNRRPTRRNRPGQIFIYVDPNNPVSTGLDPSVLRALPVFVYNKTHPVVIECSVCLSEFQEGEEGRVLTNCEHKFHLECIDMWFQSHSTCPICRLPVENPNSDKTVVSEPGSSSSGLKSPGSRLMSLKRLLSLGSSNQIGNVVIDVELAQGQGQKEEHTPS